MLLIEYFSIKSHNNKHEAFIRLFSITPFLPIHHKTIGLHVEKGYLILTLPWHRATFSFKYNKLSGKTDRHMTRSSFFAFL